MKKKNFWMLLCGLALGSIVYYLLYMGNWSMEACLTGGITMVCAVWWIFEPIPIPVTSLIPIAILPLFNVLTSVEVSASYGHSLILLLLGGFILSTAMSESGAHRRIALMMVNWFGKASDKRIVFGFMLTAAMLSMWISNTATTLMLLPVALAIFQRNQNTKLASALLLGIAYAANIGGIGTPVGTPPNLVFQQVYLENTGTEVAFITWMSWAVPVIVIFLPMMWFILTYNLKSKTITELPKMGGWTSYEKRVLWVWGVTALAWVTRISPFGGWSTWFDLPNAKDFTVALVAVVVMFIIPNAQGGRLLNWKAAQKIPWGMLLLFAGGIAIAKAFVNSGLSMAIGDMLSSIANIHVFFLLFILCFLVTFLTEITSNTATIQLLMPILAAAALGAHIEPALLMAPAAMSVSCAFMLPVATAPNVIMFSTEKIPIKMMIQKGVILNIIGTCIISTICYIIFG